MLLLFLLSWFILGIGSTLWLTLVYDNDDITVKNLFPIIGIGMFGYIVFIITLFVGGTRWYRHMNDRVIFRNRWRK
jgi:hypothetical protein